MATPTEKPEQRRRFPSLSTQILLGLVGGIACGLFFGCYCALLEPLGQAFVDLLSDKAGYPQVIFRLFATLPAFAATEVLATLMDVLGLAGRGNRLREAVYGLKPGNM